MVLRRALRSDHRQGEKIAVVAREPGKLALEVLTGGESRTGVVPTRLLGGATRHGGAQRQAHSCHTQTHGGLRVAGVIITPQ